MSHIFICTNIIQLIHFYITVPNHLNNNISVIIINKNAHKKNLIFQVKKYCKLLNFNFIDDSNKIPTFSNVNLISRTNLNVEELIFVNKLDINSWYVVEDGLVNYMLSVNNFNICKCIYLLINFYENILSFLRKIIHKLFTKKIRSFKYKKKIILKLICESENKFNIFKNLISNDNLNKNNYKLIIIGSLYGFLKKNIDSIYDPINKSAKYLNISNDEIYYIPHPRLDINSIEILVSKYNWVISNDYSAAENVIISNKNALIWSYMSTTIIYSRIIFRRKCEIFYSRSLYNYRSFKDYIKVLSIVCYFKSIGCNIRNIYEKEID